MLHTAWYLQRQKHLAVKILQMSMPNLEVDVEVEVEVEELVVEEAEVAERNERKELDSITNLCCRINHAIRLKVHSRQLA
jgi:hypothetical protein